MADTAVLSYLEKGYLPEAIINFVAYLGWFPKFLEEIYTENDYKESKEIVSLENMKILVSTRFF